MKRPYFARRRGARGDSGAGLLMVLVMAAVVAIAVYGELPRVAVEARRQKEQLLIERGEQYQRAIELFFRANGRYPARIEELENSGNRRFLRRRFVDPMTGSDDWRLIRIGPGGILLDSAIGGSRLAEQAQLARAAAQQSQTDPAGPTGPAVDAARSMDSEGQAAGTSPNVSAATVPSPPGSPGPAEPVKPPVVTASAPLTARPPVVATQSIMQAIGGSIAGVASKSDQSGIMVYHGRTKYREWEFIFDFTKRKMLTDGNLGGKETEVRGVK